MTEQHSPTHLGRGISIALVAYIFFMTASSLVWSFKGRFPTIQIIFIQNCISFLCILPIATRHGLTKLKTDHLNIHLIRDITGVLSYYLYFVAIRYLNLVDATMLNYTAPLFVPIFSWIWMKEPIQKHIWWSILIGFLGVAIILNPSRQIFEIGFLFGLFAGINSGVAFVALRALNIKHEPMSRTLFYYFLFGMFITAPFAYVFWTPPSGSEWFRVIGIGGATAVGQMLLTIAYRYGTASHLSPLGYSTAIYSGLISWFFFDRPLSLRSYIGTALIVIGGTLTYLLKKKPETVSEVFKLPKPDEKPPL
jgi:drug/metabolite transporter (DMT)-like permease